MADATSTGSEARRSARARPDARAALSGLLWWSAWCTLPALLSLWLAPERAALCAFGALAAALLATRARRERALQASRALVACALCACAGALAQPAWLRASASVGLALELAPALPPAAAPAPSAAPALWLGAGLVGPLAEELLYRERLLAALRPAGPGVAVALSSALFALPHLEPWWMLGALLLGLWLGALAWTTRGVALCIGYHAGINAACLAAGTPIRPRGACVASALAGSALLFAALRAGRTARAGAVAGGLAALLAAGSAAAAVYEFAGELALDPLLPALPEVRIQGAGVATLNGSGAGAALQTLSLAGGISGSATLPVTDPMVSNGGLVALRFAARLGSGALRPFQPAVSLSTPQLSHGSLPVHGSARLCMLTSRCSLGLDLPLLEETPAGPRGLGVGGMLTVAPQLSLRRSVLGAPWTLRTASLAVQTVSGGSGAAFASGFAHGAFSFTGSTALPGGAVSLVTPLRIESLGGVTHPSGFARLTLHFVPEPRALLVLAPSIALLVAGARRRRRLGGST